MKRNPMIAALASALSIGFGGRAKETSAPYDRPPKAFSATSKPSKPRIGNIRRALKARAGRMCFLNIRKDRFISRHPQKLKNQKWRHAYEVNH